MPLFKHLKHLVQIRLFLKAAEITWHDMRYIVLTLLSYNQNLNLSLTSEWL